jgi:5,10-methenyltetrahydrofolate synthetase
VRPLAERLRAAGATLALPVVVAPGEPLLFRIWHADAPLVAGPFDAAHPSEGPAVVPDVVIVPLLGFDAAGYRLGYGAGYYDRTLAALRPRPLALGVGFACGRLPTIRPQPHDIALDAIVTEDGVVRPGGENG